MLCLSIMNCSLHKKNIIAFALIHGVGIAGSIFLYTHELVSWKTTLLTGILFILVNISITAGYHRLFSHKSYHAAKSVQIFFLIFGAAAFEGSAIWWSSTHRWHHKCTDQDKDPHNIEKGFWFAHIGWLFQNRKNDTSNVRDLTLSPLLKFQRKYYLYISVFIAIIFPTMLASLWHESIAGFIVAGLFRITLNHHATWSINSICHYIGKKPYAPNISARDSWVCAIFTFGEGYHNYHHRFPKDYRNGIKFYHFDPTKWFIYLLSKFNLAYQLHRIPKSRILSASKNLVHSISET